MERIGGDAFDGCISLTKLVFPDKVSSIGSYAFAYCSGITSISIPISLTSIGECAFNSCSSLNEMICHCSNIPATDGNIFSGSGYADGVLYVPADAIIKYENAYPWYGWGEIKAIEEENALDVVLPDNGQKQYYTLDGKKSVTSSNGLYIIKNEDGSVQKVMVK